MPWTPIRLVREKFPSQSPLNRCNALDRSDEFNNAHGLSQSPLNRCNALDRQQAGDGGGRVSQSPLNRCNALDVRYAHANPPRKSQSPLNRCNALDTGALLGDNVAEVSITFESVQCPGLAYEVEVVEV